VVSYSMRLTDMVATYVGIQNGHSVCYLNSVMQQLFMIPTIREHIIQLPCQQVDSSDNVVPKQSFLSELKSLFMSLENSRSSHGIRSCRSEEAIDPLPLCKTIWNPLGFSDGIENKQGAYLDVEKQMDASEFLSLLLAQLSSSLGSTNPLLQVGRFICGTLCNELFIAGDDSAPVIGRNRVLTNEQFYFISVKVGTFGATAAASTAAASLASPPVAQSMIIDSLRKALDDFSSDQNLKSFWPSSGGEGGGRELLPSTSSSTLSASSLPPHFIIHLKRFRFDFLKMRQVKLNSRFEYPLSLDLWGCTAEARRERAEDAAWEQSMREGTADDADVDMDTTSALPDSSALKRRCKYVLGGVIVHAGTARDGHYYSLVKERKERKEDQRSGSGKDSAGIVTHDVTSNAPAEQVDQVEEVTRRDRWLKMNDEEVTEFSLEDLETETFGGHTHGPLKKQSAFILIYDRV
jgi:ubiquitin carboxyl-terminal hydrolase 9/24